MTLDLDAIRNRAALARSIAEGPNALARALASADDVPALLAEVERLTAERDQAIAAHGHTVDGALEQGWELVAARNELATVEQDRDRLKAALVRAEGLVEATRRWREGLPVDAAQWAVEADRRLAEAVDLYSADGGGS